MSKSKVNPKVNFMFFLMIIIFLVLPIKVSADLFLNSRTGSINLNTTGQTRLQITPGGNLNLLGVANVSISGNLSVGGNVSVGGSTLFVDSESNRVGVGTTGPLLTLHVKSTSTGGAPASSGTTPTGRARLDDASNIAIDFGAIQTNPFPAWIQAHDSTNQATNYPLVLNPNGGSVGIGTTAPAALLHIENNAPNIRLNDTDTADQAFEIRVGDSGTDNFGIFNATGEPLMSIDRFGSVGIGTTTPTNTLEVNGAGAFSAAGSTYVTSTATVSNIGLRMEHDFAVNEVSPIGLSLAIDRAGVTAAISNDWPNQAALVIENGSVGIGTTEPPYLLSVTSNTASLFFINNTIANEDGWLIQHDDQGSFSVHENNVGDRLTIQNNSGNVGIGTTTPGSYKLNVAGSISSSWTNTGTTPTQPSTVNIGPGSAGWLLMSLFNDAGSEVIRILNNGSVGIGTTSPAAKLDVQSINSFANNGSTARIYHYNNPDQDNSNAAALRIQSGITTADALHHGYLSLEQIFTGGVFDSPTFYLTPRKNSTNGQEWWGLQGVGNNRLRLIYSASDSGVGPSTSPSEFLSIDKTGNIGIGTTTPSEKLTVNGNLSVTGNCKDDSASTTCDITADIAEEFNISQVKQKVEAGDVLVIDSASDKFDKGALLSSTPYDTHVIGIVSTNPTIIMGRLRGGIAVALSGVVPVKVTLENGPIKKGDLLTTSSKTGHAMKFELLKASKADSFEELQKVIDENERRSNAILGKSLEYFNGDSGKIMALITLQ
jgi:hypothetical protein